MFLSSGQTAEPGKKTSHVHSNNAKSAKPSTVEQNISIQPVTYVWAGKEYTVYPGTSAVDNSDVVEKDKTATPSFFVPRQLQQKMSDSNVCYAQNINSSNSNSSHIDESSFMNTVSHVRNKVSNVSLLLNLCICIYILYLFYDLNCKFQDGVKSSLSLSVQTYCGISYTKKMFICCF